MTFIVGGLSSEERLAGLDRWMNCLDCSLGARACKHVMGRGKLPCKVLLIGEGPGKSEDRIGQAFTGPAARLLYKAIGDEVLDHCAFTNLVACRPVDDSTGANRPPTQFEIESCAPRLRIVLGLARPIGIVRLGKLTGSQPIHRLAKGLGLNVQVFDTSHPAAILRRGGTDAPDWDRYRASFRYFFRQLGLEA